MVKLLNDIGHGANTWPPSKGINASGGVPGMAEHEFNAAVGSEVKRLLQGKVSTFEAQGAYKNDVPLSTRTRLYNSEYAKDRTAIGMSHHANANGNKSVAGFGVFYWRGSAQGKKLAQMILAEYKREFPGYPIWGTGLFESKVGDWTNFAILRDTTAPFVLIEWDFFTNDAARRRLLSTNYRKRCAKVAAKVACDWYGIKFEDDKPAVKPEAPAPITPVAKPKEEIKVAEKKNEPSSWAQSTVKKAIEMGVTDGSRLHDPVTREEAIVLAMRAAGHAPKLK